MVKKIKASRFATMIAALVLASGLFVSNARAAAPGAVTMTVTAVGNKDMSPPIVTKDDVQLYLNKERTQVADWKHGGKLYLAVLIDDSLDGGIANQWGDLKSFFDAQPDTTYISVAYARNGTDRKSTRLNSSHVSTSYAVFCLKKKSHVQQDTRTAAPHMIGHILLSGVV